MHKSLASLALSILLSASAVAATAVLPQASPPEPREEGRSTDRFSSALTDSSAVSQILLLDDGCVISSQFWTALVALGLDGVTTTTDMDGFADALTGGTTWDLVLVDSYNSEMSETALEVLADYIRSGGLLAVGYWNLANEPALAAALQASPSATFDTSQAIRIWDATHALFTTPNPLGDPISPFNDVCTQDGGRFEPLPQGRAIGGFTTSPTTGQAAIVIGNSGRTVLLGEVLHVFASIPELPSGGPEGSLPAEPGPYLAANTIHYLLDVYLFGTDFETETTCRWTATTPPVPEVCNSLDDDCDDLVDNVEGSGEACDTGDPGICAAGRTACVGSELGCLGTTAPEIEQCNGLDDDCDGTTDEGNPQGGLTCDTGNAGVCSIGATLCTGGALACNQLFAPGDEICDGLDNDCNGLDDDGDPGGGVSCDTGQPGICQEGTTRCDYGTILCEPLQIPEDFETLFCGDGLDNDCDGLTDCADDDCASEPVCCLTRPGAVCRGTSVDAGW